MAAGDPRGISLCLMIASIAQLRPRKCHMALIAGIMLGRCKRNGLRRHCTQAGFRRVNNALGNPCNTDNPALRSSHTNQLVLDIQKTRMCDRRGNALRQALKLLLERFVGGPSIAGGRRRWLVRHDELQILAQMKGLPGATPSSMNEPSSSAFIKDSAFYESCDTRLHGLVYHLSIGLY